MQIKRLVKALQNNGLHVEKKTYVKNYAYIYSCSGEKYKCQWHEYPHDQGKVDSIKIQEIDEYDDLSIDSCPGFYVDKIKDLVKWLIKNE